MEFSQPYRRVRDNSSHVHHLFLEPHFFEAIHVTKYHQNLFTILHQNLTIMYD